LLKKYSKVVLKWRTWKGGSQQKREFFVGEKISNAPKNGPQRKGLTMRREGLSVTVTAERHDRWEEYGETTREGGGFQLNTVSHLKKTQF